MTFLDDQNVTVFFSTWSTSHVQSSVLQINERSEITVDRVVKAIGSSQIGGVIVDDPDVLPETATRYNSRMIFRWIQGLRKVYESGDFDLIIMLRPDLFFNPERPLNYLGLDPNRLHTMWATSTHLGRLQDVLFVASPNIFKKIFSSEMLDEWNTAENSDWHTWFFEYVSPLVHIQNFATPDTATWARSTLQVTNPTFELAVQAQIDWRDAVVAEQLQKYGEKFILDQWGNDVVTQVKRKISEGYFLLLRTKLRRGALIKWSKALQRNP